MPDPFPAAAQIRRLPATVGILTGLFLAAMEATVIGTAMPSIVADLRGVHMYFLPFTVYLIVSTVAVPIFGRLSDVYGRKRFHAAGILIFLAGSALCGFARSMTALVVFRGVQAVGAGAMIPLSFTMIAELFPLEQRARMQGAISGLWGVASLVGPPLGGFITRHFGWPYVFFVNIPLGLVALAIVQAVWRDPPRPVRTARLDVPGAVGLVLVSATLMSAFGFVSRGSGWSSPEVVALAGSFLAFLVLTIRIERRSSDPFLAFDLYRSRIFWAGILCGGFGVVNLFCVTSYLPLFVQAVVGGTEIQSGMILTPMMVGWVAVSSVSGLLLLRFGYRNLALVGTLLSVVAYGLLSGLDARATWGKAAVAVVVLGTGLGCILAPLLIAAQNSVGRNQLGAATSLTQFSRTLMGTLGIACMGTVMSVTLASQLAARPELAGLTPDAVVHPLRRGSLAPETAAALRGVMAASLRPVFLIGLGAAVLGFLSALLLPEGRARDLAVSPVPADGAVRTPDSPRG